MLSFKSQFISYNCSISSSNSCLSLKFYYNSSVSSFIRFSFLFIISSNCSIIAELPYESLEHCYYTLFLAYYSRIISFYSIFSLWRRVRNAEISTMTPPCVEFPEELTWNTTSFNSFSLNKVFEVPCSINFGSSLLFVIFWSAKMMS